MDSRPSPREPVRRVARRARRAPPRRFQADGSGPRAAGPVVLLRRTALPAGRGRRPRDRRQASGLCPLLRPSPLPDRRTASSARCLRRRRLLKCWTSGAGPAPPGRPGRCSAAAGRITGFDRHPWAVAEANWTYRVLGLHGRALRQDLSRVRLAPCPGPRHPRGLHDQRAARRPPERLADAAARRSRPRRHRPHHRTHRPADGAVVARLGGPRSSPPAGEPTNGASMPRCPAGSGELARSAGLNPRELRARSLFAG